MIYGIDKNSDLQVKLGDDKIDVTKNEGHVGVILTESKSSVDEFIKDRISKCRRTFYSIQNLGSYRVPTPPSVLSKLYWSICVPKMIYGLENTDNLRNKVEIAHGDICKTIQGLPRQTVNAGCIATMGWLSMETILDMSRMLFYGDYYVFQSAICLRESCCID